MAGRLDEAGGGQHEGPAMLARKEAGIVGISVMYW